MKIEGDYIFNVIKEYHDCASIPGHRFKSWEHCFNAFHTIEDTDHLSLHLAFYLASWGMLRGSGGLLQKDYKVHVPVVQLLLSQKDCKLWDIEVNHQRLPEIFNISNKIKKHYSSINIIKKDNSLKNINATETLITKILLGTIGCTPAYDRYFVGGMVAQNIVPRKFNSQSLESLIKFANDNSSQFELAQTTFQLSTGKYPIMKLVDMFFLLEGVKSVAGKKN